MFINCSELFLGRAHIRLRQFQYQLKPLRGRRPTPPLLTLQYTGFNLSKNPLFDVMCELAPESMINRLMWINSKWSALTYLRYGQFLHFAFSILVGLSVPCSHVACRNGTQSVSDRQLSAPIPQWNYGFACLLLPVVSLK